jgi:hypothetical protein
MLSQVNKHLPHTNQVHTVKVAIYYQNRGSHKSFRILIIHPNSRVPATLPALSDTCWACFAYTKSTCCVTALANDQFHLQLGVQVYSLFIFHAANGCMLLELQPVRHRGALKEARKYTALAKEIV